MLFERSEIGIDEKIKESLVVIKYSIVLIERVNVEEFSNVIATQLRLLVLDKSNSLLPKNKKEYLFPKVRKLEDMGMKGNLMAPVEMFEDEYEITMDQWLNQVIRVALVNGIKDVIRISDIIKYRANKSGGAHVDSKLKTKHFNIECSPPREIVSIAKCLLKVIGSEYNEDEFWKRKI